MKKSPRALAYARVWQVLGWIQVLAIVYLSLTPSPPTPPGFLSWDKAQHTLAYGCLALWFAQAFRRHWRWPLFLLLLGGGLEFAQGLGGVRTSDPADMVANSIGVVLGYLLALTPLGWMLGVLDRWLAEMRSGRTGRS